MPVLDITPSVEEESGAVIRQLGDDAGENAVKSLDSVSPEDVGIQPPGDGGIQPPDGEGKTDGDEPGSSNPDSTEATLSTKKENNEKNPKFKEISDKAKGYLEPLKENPLNTLLMLFLGIGAILALTVQDKDECRQNCKDRTNSTLDCSDQTPTIPSSNCPDDGDCDTFCKDACSDDNRLNRALCMMKKNPAQVLAAAGKKLIASPFNIWDTFKYEIIGFVLLLGGFFLYQYTSSWASSAGSALNLAGTKRGKRITTDLDKVVKPLRRNS